LRTGEGGKRGTIWKGVVVKFLGTGEENLLTPTYYKMRGRQRGKERPVKREFEKNS